MTSRIEPLEPPYSADLQSEFDRIMNGAPPLRLFRTVARNPRVLQRMMAGHLLDRGSVSLRLRELAVLRTCARTGAEYEWGVHVAIFGASAGWTDAQLAATVHSDATDPSWQEDESLVVALCDQLHDSSTVDEDLWNALRMTFSEDQLVELVMLAGLYHAVSFLVNALHVGPEAFAPRFPAAP